jgi:hypothetical protein
MSKYEQFILEILKLKLNKNWVLSEIKERINLQVLIFILHRNYDFVHLPKLMIFFLLFCLRF